MHLATRRVRNIDRLGQEIGGDVSFVVPRVVLTELKNILDHSVQKRTDAQQTLLFAKKLKTISICEPDDLVMAADDAIVDHAARHKCIVATMDRHLKQRLRRDCKCAIMSFSNDNIVLEAV